MSNSILGYCRPGFEADAGLELQTKASELGFYGFFKANKNHGFFTFESNEALSELFNRLQLADLIFTRQWFSVVAFHQELARDDRLSSLKLRFDALPVVNEVLIEHPDTESGKELSKFCRKFTVPMRQALKKAGKYDESKGKVSLITFFTSSTSCYFGYVPNNNKSRLAGGIMRLKFPQEAPSRSTLKLDEAFLTFVSEKDSQLKVRAGMKAVDLGACPGGWTYQLVRRGMFVQAVDNGLMSDSLMESGQVSHFQEDGFKFKPKKKNIDWLVCDMIEQPQKVARLMAQWLNEDLCRQAIFNLKLPMKKRFESVLECFDIIEQQISGTYKIQSKHLYHDRDEITVYLSK